MERALDREGDNDDEDSNASVDSNHSADAADYATDEAYEPEGDEIDDEAYCSTEISQGKGKRSLFHEIEQQNAAILTTPQLPLAKKRKLISPQKSRTHMEDQEEFRERK